KRAPTPDVSAPVMMTDERYGASGVGRDDRDFARDSAGFHQVLRLAEVFQREHLADHRLDMTAFDETHRVDQFALVAQMRPEIVLLLVPQQANVEMSVEARGRTAGDDGAAPLEALHGDGPGLGAGVFEDDIGAAAVGDFAHFLEDVVFLAMEYELGAELFAKFEFVVGGGDRDRARVEELRDLNRHHAEAAGGAPDQHEVTGLDMCARHQHPPYGDEHERDGGGFLEAQVGRLGQ